jgi:hypothetical protein
VTNARGVTIHVGSVGFLHVSDVLVTFASGPIESVRVDDVLYTGQMLTLLTWLYEFVSKRLKGARLRDGLPVARTETSRTDAKDAPESQQSPSRDSEEKTKSRRAAILRQSSLAAATREGEPGRSPGVKAIMAHRPTTRPTPPSLAPMRTTRTIEETAPRRGRRSCRRCGARVRGWRFRKAEPRRAEVLARRGRRRAAGSIPGPPTRREALTPLGPRARA